MKLLTEAGIKAAIRHAPASGRAQTVIKDAAPRGAGRLALIVRPMASRVSSEWYAIYFRDGARKLIKIGAYPEMPLAEAREKFKNEFSPSISIGADPASRYTRAAHRRKADRTSVRGLFEAYVADLKRRDKSAAYTAERVLLKRQDSAVAMIGADRDAGSIEAADILPLLTSIHERGRIGMANSMRGWIHSAFAYGIKARHDYTRQGSGLIRGIKFNPVAAIPTDPLANCPSNRCLTPAELRAFWRWCEDNEHRSNLCLMLRLMAATGQRVQEIMRLTATGYIRDESILHWETTKNGKPHTIPLPPQAAAILSTMRPNAHGLYFPHRFKPEQHALYTGPNKITTTYIEETGALPFVARDLRRTFKTLAGRAGVSKEVRDMLQNHTRADVSSKHYDRYDYMTEKRAGMALWADYLAGILSGEIA